MPLLDLFWSMLWFFLWIMWVYLVITVFVDIFRSSDLGGLMKAVWALFVLLVPVLGVFVYLVARGGKMQQRAIDDAAAREAAARQYIRESAGSGAGTSDELAKLAKLRDDGVITDAEFQAQKTKVLA